MSSNSQNKSDNQEIDLSQISKKIGDFFESFSTKIFNGILFLKRNKLIIGVLFVTGIVLGFIADKTIKKYDNNIIVTPNFGSNDYLNTKIYLINNKIKENDTVFLKEVVGIKEPKLLKEIEIEPIVDVYKFINNSQANFDFIKLMGEDGDIDKVIQGYITSKNYPYHSINFSTSKRTSQDKTVKPILDYLNDSDYYSEIQKEYLNNVKLKMIANDSIISQIDGVLNSFSKAVNGSQRNEKLIYYNENTQLNDIITTKNSLTNEQGSHRIELINFDKIIKDNSSAINMKNTDAFRGKMKFVMPILFILIFILIGYLKSYYKKQLEKIKE
jgi:preprotein translocase subunit SecG